MRGSSVPLRGALLALALAAAAVPAFAREAEIQVRAKADAREIGENDAVTLTVEVRGGNLPDVGEPDLGALADFTIASGPSSSSSTSMVWDGSGGSVTSIRRYQWALLPRRRGDLKIPPVAVTIGGRTYTTSEIAVRVVEAGKAPRGGAAPSPSTPFDALSPGRRGAEVPSGDVYLEVVPDRTEAYVGQQVLLTYRLYTQLELTSLPQPRQLPSYTGFWVEEIPVDPRTTIRRVVLRGKEYAELTLMKKALFPAKSGDLKIDETIFEVPVVVRSDDPFDRFFSSSRPIYRRTPAITIRALPLPEAGRPASFTGAVGRFELAVAADRAEAQVNDAIGLTVTVSGDGNLRAVGEPLLPEMPDYRRFDPKMEESREVVGDRVRGKRAWTYVLVPLAAGERPLPQARFSWFDPEARTYRETAGPALPMKILRGAGGNALAEGTGVRREVVATGRDIRFIKPVEGLRLHRGGLRGSAWFWLLAALPVAGHAVLFAVRRRREHLQANAGFFRRRRASRNARRRLSRARALAGGEEAPFHAELDRALTGYLADKLDTAAAGLTRDRIREELDARKVPEPLQRRLFEILEACDAGRFAPAGAGRRSSATLLGAAGKLLDELERALG